MKYKYKGIKMNINDKNGIVRLIIHVREEGGPYYKTYYEKETDLTFTSRLTMLNCFKDIIKNLIEKEK